MRLRRYIMVDRLKRLDQAIQVAGDHADSSINRSARLYERSEELDGSYQEWGHEHAA